MNANHSRGLAGIAEHLQTYGRNGDTVLVHMTKGEVQGLQALAVQHGGTLTINPHTGLVEASFLKKLLPTLAGIAGTFVGIPPWVTAAAVGGAMGVASGSLKKGLMAGLQAYGGASLASGLGAGATSAATKAAGMTDMLAAQTASQAGYAAAPNALITNAAGATLGSANAAVNAAGQNIGLGLAGATPSAASAAAPGAIMSNRGADISAAFGSSAAPAAGMTDMLAAQTANQAAYNAAPVASRGLMGMLPQGVQDFGGRFAAAAREGLPAGAPGFVSKFAPQVAGMGVMSTLSGLGKSGGGGGAPSEAPSNYDGPYIANAPNYNYRTADEMYKTYYPTGGGVRRMTPEEAKYAGYRPPTTDSKGKTTYYAAGGETLEDGAFIMDARTVSELGNGSSGAGQDRLKKIGGKPIKGRGDGTSDSIRAKMGGKEARVARDEVKIPAKAVKKLGRGNHSRGANKLYDLMDRAKHARSTAERGQDSGLASLFGA